MPAIDEEGLKKLQEVKAKTEAVGIVWDDLTPEQKASLYRDYTGEEMQADTMLEISRAGLGGTQAGNIFVADSPFEAIGALGGAYMHSKKKKELSKQKAQAYELAGGLGASAQDSNQKFWKEQFAAERQQRMADKAALSPPPPPPPGAGGPPGGQPQTGPPMASAGRPPMGGQPMPQQMGAEKSMGMQGNSGTMGGVPRPPPGAMPPGVGGGSPPVSAQGVPGGFKGAIPQAPQGQPSGAGMGVANSPQFKKMMEKLKLEEMLKRLRGG